MNKFIHIICNMRSGAGRASKTVRQVESYLQSRQIVYQTYVTQYHGHASIIACEIVQRWQTHGSPTIIVIGGDGTLHEVVEGLYTTEMRPPISYIPAGTGNDFARAWLKKRPLHELIDVAIRANNVTKVPFFSYSHLTQQANGIVLNNMGFGFDAEVNADAKRLQTKPFYQLKWTYKLCYLVAIFSCLKRLKAFDVTITVDNTTIVQRNCMLASVMNIPYAGGGIRLDNLVSPTTEEVSLILYHDISFKAIVGLLWQVLVTHSQHESQYTTRYTGSNIRVAISNTIRSHVDGEDLGNLRPQIEYQVTHYPFYLH